MKRKVWLISALALAVISLAACGTKDKETVNSSEASSVKESSVASSESSEAMKQSVIKGVLKEDVTVDGDKVSFFMTEVEGVSDLNEIAKGIGEEGVILNAESKEVDGEFKADDFKAGQAIEVTLDANPIMTRSLPPQIPGASIISIKKL
ncbi:hypothetical protein [uncultured Vagococcus sp.]|uniref:hypothetical protein n=1 Tax=uncultured Vagococcus sp. TaxID=189676 RepID=UPI0028D749CB|nr:hypothetical protein [uncultured Vagococcus sp.]